MSEEPAPYDPTLPPLAGRTDLEMALLGYMVELGRLWVITQDTAPWPDAAMSLRVRGVVVAEVARRGPAVRGAILDLIARTLSAIIGEPPERFMDFQPDAPRPPGSQNPGQN